MALVPRDSRFRDLVGPDADDTYDEAHRATMSPWAELVAKLPDPCPFTFQMTDEGFAARYTGPLTALNRETHELRRLGDAFRALGYQPDVVRTRRETVLHLYRSETGRRAA